jgi:hypothetical protein
MLFMAGAACSSNPSDVPEVATLATASPAASSSPPSPPRERLDGTHEEFLQMQRPWEECMEGHGMSAERIKRDRIAVDEADLKRARADCDPKYLPLPPWEKDPANPEYKDFMRAVAACLEKEGVPVALNSDGEITYSEKSDEVSRDMELSGKCEREVAAGRK